MGHHIFPKFLHAETRCDLTNELLFPPVTQEDVATATLAHLYYDSQLIPKGQDVGLLLPAEGVSFFAFHGPNDRFAVYKDTDDIATRLLSMPIAPEPGMTDDNCSWTVQSQDEAGTRHIDLEWKRLGSTLRLAESVPPSVYPFEFARYVRAWSLKTQGATVALATEGISALESDYSSTSDLNKIADQRGLVRGVQACRASIKEIYRGEFQAP